MKPEPLKDKEVTKHKAPEEDRFYNEKDIKSAVEFYKRYSNSDGFDRLKPEQPEVYDEWIKLIETIGMQRLFGEKTSEERYKEFIFNKQRSQHRFFQKIGY